jgi:hypothetical protein
MGHQIYYIDDKTHLELENRQPLEIFMIVSRETKV